jgi:hypothetical protein
MEQVGFPSKPTLEKTRICETSITNLSNTLTNLNVGMHLTYREVQVVLLLLEVRDCHDSLVLLLVLLGLHFISSLLHDIEHLLRTE